MPTQHPRNPQPPAQAFERAIHGENGATERQRRREADSARRRRAGVIGGVIGAAILLTLLAALLAGVVWLWQLVL